MSIRRWLHFGRQTEQVIVDFQGHKMQQRNFQRLAFFSATAADHIRKDQLEVPLNDASVMLLPSPRLV